MTIPRGTHRAVVNALEGGRMMPDGSTRREWLVVVRFDLYGQAVLDWFGEEQYRDALEERYHLYDGAASFDRVYCGYARDCGGKGNAGEDSRYEKRVIPKRAARGLKAPGFREVV